MAKIKYQNECEVEENNPDTTILEVSLKNNIPHVHACGGNARCSTCRVIVTEGLENLQPRNTREEVLAEKKGFSDDIRLACQTTVNSDITLRRLVRDENDIKLAFNDRSCTGRECDIAVLFCDIRNFTPFSENNFPYDVVHVLNRFFLNAGNAVLHHNGFIDKYMGDGMMALFGASGGSPGNICEQAVSAALEIIESLTDFNEYLTMTLGTQFKIGIGIDFGEVILGEIGHPEHKAVSAIGQTVNTASRIESATKDIGGSLLVSQTVLDNLPSTVLLGEKTAVSLKGCSGTHFLHEVLSLPVQ